MRTKPSSYDIARSAGVSQTTVSFVLNGRTDKIIGAETRERVLRSARELGYLPNRSARTIQSGKFDCITLLGSTVQRFSLLSEGLQDGIMDALSHHKLHLIMARLGDTTVADESVLPAVLQEWMSDGLLINYNQDIPEPLRQMVEAYRLPSVWINSKQEQDAVYIDDFAAGMQAAEQLLMRGHRRIVYVGYKGVTHYSAADRQLGYEQAMKTAGLIPRVVVPEEGLISVASAGSLLEGDSAQPAPTAIIVYVPALITPLIIAALSRRIRIPEDLSLVTFDEKSDYPEDFCVGSFRLPTREMGDRAVNMLVQRILHPADRLPPVSVSAVFQAGTTVASAPPHP